MLLSLIVLTTLGLYVMIAVMDSFTLTPAEFSYLKYASQVIPNSTLSFEPGVVSRIQANPDVERVITVNDRLIYPPSWGISSSITVLGIPQDDLQYLIERCHMRIKVGRLPSPLTPTSLCSRKR